MSEKLRTIVGQIFVPAPTADTTPLPATGRAGRHLPAALATGVTLLVAVILALLYARPVFLGFVGFLILLASWEVSGALARKNLRVALPPIYVGGLAMFIMAAVGSLPYVMYLLYFTFMAIILWRLAQGSKEGPIADVTASVFVLLYVPFLGSFVGLISAQSDSPWPLVFFVLTVVANDLGGWMAGVLFGKHPLAPKLSPKKSWEGFAGSVLLCAAVAYGGTLLLQIPWWWLFPMAAAGSVVGTLGDLTESLIKRDVGLKDMSNIMPGHGGAMDRLDSLLFAAPAFYLIFSLALGW